MMRTPTSRLAALLTLLTLAAPSHAQRVYVISDGVLQRALVNGECQETIVAIDDGRGVAIDRAAGKVYWTDFDPGNPTLERADLDGSSAEEIADLDFTSLGVVVDHAGGKVYWGDGGGDKVSRADLDGANVEDLVTGLGDPNQIDIDFGAGKIYWSDFDSTIRRSDLDGSNLETVLSGVGARGLALDWRRGKLYFTTSGSMRRANLDGSDLETLFSGLDNCYGMALDVSRDRVYWVERNSSKVRRAHLDGTGMEDLVTGVFQLWDVALDGPPRPGWVLGQQKISDTEGGLAQALVDAEYFGTSVASVGDLDGDGVADMVVGAQGPQQLPGSIWILFLNADRTVKAEQHITAGVGGFTGDLVGGDYFGSAVAPLGDFDGDGVMDLVVGAQRDHEAGADRGSVWILLLNTDGTVKGHHKISELAGGFTGTLENFDNFGNSVAPLGDVDGDGVQDLAVGAFRDGDGGWDDAGAVWILFLNADGTVKGQQKISADEGGFPEPLGNFHELGFDVAALGDLDGDGVPDLAAGTPGDDDGGQNRGCVYVLFLNADGTVKAYQKISDTAGGFSGELDDSDNFGESVGEMGDLDGDGVVDLSVGARWDDDGSSSSNRGAVWLLSLHGNGTVKDHLKISDTEGGFAGGIMNSDTFGNSVTRLGDVDGDGCDDLAVGAYLNDDGGDAHGSVWVLSLAGPEPQVWMNLGNGLGGTSLLPPVLEGSGTACPGTDVTLTLSGALENALAYTCVGIDTVYLPAKGGVLVPNIDPPGFYVSLSTDAMGGFAITATWPDILPVGTPLYFQIWVKDPGGIHGWSASNGLAGAGL